jgi:hypothetical protein
VREITFRAPIFDRSVISASVIPSTKYACCASPEKFFSGSTASEVIRGATASESPASGGGPLVDTEIQA